MTMTIVQISLRTTAITFERWDVLIVKLDGTVAKNKLCQYNRAIEASEAITTRLFCIIDRISVYNTVPYSAQN